MPDPFAWDDDDTTLVLATFPILGAQRPDTVVDVVVDLTAGTYTALEHAGAHVLAEHLVTHNAAAAIVAAMTAAGWRNAVEAELILAHPRPEART